MDRIRKALEEKLAVELAKINGIPPFMKCLGLLPSSMSGEQKSKPMLFKTLAGYFFEIFS